MKNLSTIIIFTVLMYSHLGGFAQCCNFTYQQQVEPATSAATFGVALADFDGDGDMDAVSISAYYGVDVYFNNGSGTFTLNAQYATGSNGDFFGVEVADVDGDNDMDIIAIPFYTSASLTILINNGLGIFYATTVSSSIAANNAAIGDVDSDGDIDLFIPSTSGSSGKLFKNSGYGSFTLSSSISGAVGHDAEFGDLDGDGDLDLFVTKNSSTGIAVFLNNGTGVFTQTGTNFSSNTTQVALGDLDGDGDLDAWVGKMNNEAEIYFNNGTAVFSLDTTFTTNSYCKGVELFDMDNDGDLDAFMSFYSGNPQVWTVEENLGYSLCYQAPTGSSSHGMTLGDVNGDGNVDMYVGHFSNTDGDYVFFNNSPSISYPYSEYCYDYDTLQNVTLIGATGGLFYSYPTGLAINSTSGAFTPSLSIPGNYVVKYEVSGCIVSKPILIKSVDVTVFQQNDTIFAALDSATYQWLHCDLNNLPISGANQQYYVPDSTGNYSALISYNGCSDTSVCEYFFLDDTGIESLPSSEYLTLYPNPAEDQVFIQFSQEHLNSEYILFDYQGRIIEQNKILQLKLKLNTQDFPAGLYWIAVKNHKLKAVKFIKL